MRGKRGRGVESGDMGSGEGAWVGGCRVKGGGKVRGEGAGWQLSGMGGVLQQIQCRTVDSGEGWGGVGVQRLDGEMLQQILWMGWGGT